MFSSTFFRLILSLAGIILPLLSSYAQYQGKVIERFTLAAIPFVHIVVNDGEKEFLSDIDGNFNIPQDTSIKKLTFKAYLYRPIHFYTDSLTADSIGIIKLNKFRFFDYESENSDTALTIIKNVLFHQKENELSKLKYYKYSTYNKATLNTEKVDKTNHKLDKVFKFLSLRFNKFEEDQHFMIIESVTEKKAYNKNHFKEEIKGTKSTIVDVPTLFIETTQLQSFSPYSDFVNVGGKNCVGRLHRYTFARYAFSVLHTLHLNADTIFVVKYNPYPKKQFDGIKGLLFINKKNSAVQFFTATPAREKKLKMSAFQSYTFYPEENIWFPDRTKTIAVADKAGDHFVMTLDTYISDVDLKYFVRKKNFDEVVLEFPDYAFHQDDSFWVEKRKIPLTEYDKNTYAYYDSVDQKKTIQRALKFGENIYYGFISYKFLNFDLKRILNLNKLEGIRVGIGVHTNEKFSNVLKLGGYYGYGTTDNKHKYGYDITISPRNFPISYNSVFSDDVVEAGGIFYPFNHYQYSSEPLRRIRLRIMDRVIQWDNSISIHPAKFLDTRIAFDVSRNETTYDYQFRDETDNIFYFSELKIGLRYAYSEQYIKLPTNRIRVGSRYPILYFQFTKGFDNLYKGEYNYKKYDMRIDFNFDLLEFGKTGIQITTGIVDGAIPYTKLYNQKGSLRNPSPVIHNSFETMRYNEFLSDRYISFFLSHNFGKLYFKPSFIRPSILLIHNFGVGSLKNPSYHKKIEFKTMEKGYVESGILLDNILVFRLTGIKIGLGAGCFFRYGPYANSLFKDNFVFKFSIKFGL